MKIGKGSRSLHPVANVVSGEGGTWHPSGCSNPLGILFGGERSRALHPVVNVVSGEGGTWHPSGCSNALGILFGGEGSGLCTPQLFFSGEWSRVVHPVAVLWRRVVASCAPRSCSLAERVGFEPTVGTSPTTVFETVPFNHSGTSPVCG